MIARTLQRHVRQRTHLEPNPRFLEPFSKMVNFGPGSSLCLFRDDPVATVIAERFYDQESYPVDIERAEIVGIGTEQARRTARSYTRRLGREPTYTLAADVGNLKPGEALQCCCGDPSFAFICWRRTADRCLTLIRLPRYAAKLREHCKFLQPTMRIALVVYLHICCQGKDLATRVPNPSRFYAAESRSLIFTSHQNVAEAVIRPPAALVTALTLAAHDGESVQSWQCAYSPVDTAQRDFHGEASRGAVPPNVLVQLQAHLTIVRLARIRKVLGILPQFR